MTAPNHLDSLLFFLNALASSAIGKSEGHVLVLQKVSGELAHFGGFQGERSRITLGCAGSSFGFSVLPWIRN